MAKNNNTLVFNGLMQGMSWDQIKEAKDEIKRHQGEKQPTRKDILTDWIIGKDYMLQQQGNTFDSGGFAGIDWKSGNFKYNGEDGEPVVGNTNWLGAASSVLQLAGDAFSGYNNIENKKDEFNTQLNQFQNQRFNIGDNAFLASEWNNRMLLGDAPTREQFGYKNGWKVGLSALQNGRTTAATTGNIWLGAGMAVADIAKNIGLNLKAESAQDEALKRYNIAQGQQPELFNYSADQAQRINAFNQLQNMAKNGGKLKKSHKFAEGGLLNTYDYGLEEVNAGGSHEENPNEGVVVSYAPDGLPNKVEEGETIHNDYVYSKRLEANKKVLNNNLLDEKYEGKSFADISKKLTEDRKQRPNDSISIRTNEENLSRLQGAQEELKLDNKTREVKRFLGSLNNDQLNALQQEMMDEYEAYVEQLAQQQEQEDQAYQEEQAAQEGMFGKGGHLLQYGGFQPYEFEIVNGNVFAHRNVNRNGNTVTLTIPEVEFTPEMLTAYETWNQRNNENTVSPKIKPTNTVLPNNTTSSKINTKPSLSTVPTLPFITDSSVKPNLTINSYPTSLESRDIPKVSKVPKIKGEAEGKASSSLAPLRFAEAFGSAGQYLSDILGLTNQPDYSNARMYQRAIDNIGGVNFTPIGNYLTYIPIDTEYLANQQMATAAARRNYDNVAGNYTLGLLNNYNTLNQIGATAMAARQQDQEQKNKVAEFNRATNEKNSLMSLDAQKQNAALRAQRAQEYRYLADMMTKERDTNEAARAANYQNFMSNLAAIGREDFNYDQIKWMIDHGVFPVGAESYLTGLKIK